MKIILTSKDFKAVFPSKDIIALVIEDFTYFYRFHSKMISPFMKIYLHDEYPKWKKVFFYEFVGDKLDTENCPFDLLFENMKFLFVIAMNLSPEKNKFEFRNVASVPNLSGLKGKRTKIIVIND